MKRERTKSLLPNSATLLVVDVIPMESSSLGYLSGIDLRTGACAIVFIPKFFTDVKVCSIEYSYDTNFYSIRFSVDDTYLGMVLR